MKTRFDTRAAALSAASLAVLLASTPLSAAPDSNGAVTRDSMYQQMQQMQAAGQAMRRASGAHRDQAMAAHRHDMMQTMHMMRQYDGMGGMGGNLEDMGTGAGNMGSRPGGMGSGMGSGMGPGMGGGMGPGTGRADDASGSDDIRSLRRRLDRMEIMMSQMLDHMDVYESHHPAR